MTAEKMPSTAQSTPAAIMVQSGDDLVRHNITSLSGLDEVVPGLSVTAFGDANLTFLRGVGQFSSAAFASPGVAFLYNGVYMPAQAAYLPFFDVNRVEVLPGPQGTLYGHSAAGGIINVITNQPTQTLEGSLLVEGGNYSAFHTTGVLNVPLTDTFAIRGAVDFNRHTGYFSDGQDDAHSIAGRLSALFKPNEDFSASVEATDFTITDVGEGAPVVVPTPLSIYPPNPSDPYEDPYPTAGLHNDQRIQSVTGNPTYRFDGLVLTHLAGYEHDSNQTLVEDGSVPAAIATKEHDISNELRLSSDTHGRFTWLIGLYWYEASFSDSTTVLFSATPSPLVDGLVALGTFPASEGTLSTSNQNSYAAFVQGMYAVTGTVRLTVGGRYSNDEISGGSTTIVDGAPFGAPANAIKDGRRGDWKVGIEGDVAPHSLLYANIQTGYLPGGFQGLPAGLHLPLTFEPETLLAYTVGSKNRFLDNRLQANVEFFYYDYNDLQVSYVNPNPPEPVLGNAPKTTIYGAQLDIDWLLATYTEVFLSAAPLHPYFTNFRNPGPNPNLPIGANLSGYQIQQAPFLSGFAGVQQKFPLGSVGTLTARVQTYYNSGYWSTYTHDPNTRQAAYTRTDVTLTYAPVDEKWSVAAYGRNLENSAVYSAFGSGVLDSVVGTGLQPPRTYGVRATMNFR